MSAEPITESVVSQALLQSVAQSIEDRDTNMLNAAIEGYTRLAMLDHERKFGRWSGVESAGNPAPQPA